MLGVTLNHDLLLGGAPTTTYRGCRNVKVTL
jgi:hypothetical protein